MPSNLNLTTPTRSPEVVARALCSRWKQLIRHLDLNYGRVLHTQNGQRWTRTGLSRTITAGLDDKSSTPGVHELSARRRFVGTYCRSSSSALYSFSSANFLFFPLAFFFSAPFLAFPTLFFDFVRLSWLAASKSPMATSERLWILPILSSIVSPVGGRPSMIWEQTTCRL
ncbi:hypothetical protein PIIN_07516 [Serendipita indica DSM 11827]|uniref:F-box domain-containing protein n=1 Tax=Serendipita indica (strain DSM 11827) TaxID=1109443 RepID=G4TQH1_SERID|nr:hypothetical protein PIIN_07516 [Serendipita indica DSM 11827]